MLIIISIFLSGYYIINNYKPLLEKFGITLEEDCNFSLSKISCNYVNISSKNSNVILKNLNAKFYLKNIFSDDKILDLDIENINLRLKQEKQSKKEVPNLKKFFKYSYNILKMSNIYVENINIDTKYFKAKGLSFRSSENKFSILKPFYIAYNDSKIRVFQFKGFIDKAKNKLVIEKINGSLFKSEFFLKGYYSSNMEGGFNGYLKGKLTKIKDFSLKDFNLILNLKLTSSKIKYSIKGDIENIESTKIGTIDNVSLDLAGFFDNKLVSDVSFNFYTVYLFNEYFLKDFSLKGKFRANENFTDYKGRFYLTSSKFENTFFRFNNLNSNFYIKNNGKTTIKGTLSLNQKLKLDFVSKIKTKQDLSIIVNNINGKFENIILALKQKPEWLKNLKGRFLANLNYKTGKNIDVEVNVKDLNLLGVKFSNSFANLVFNPKNLDFKAKGKLFNENSYINFLVQSKNKNLSGKLDYENVDISDLVWIKHAKIRTVLSGKGEIYGSLTSPKFNLFGKGKFFEYKKLYIPDVNYEFLYENKKISIVAKHKRNIKSLVYIAFKPFNLKLDVQAKKAEGKYLQELLNELNPKLFAYIKPKEVNGKLNINVLNKDFKINLDFVNSKVLLSPIENVFIANLKGTISRNNLVLTGNFGKKNFVFKDFYIKDIQGNFELKNKNFSLSVFARDSKNLDSFFANFFMNMDIANNILDTNFSLSGEKLNYHIALSGNTRGEIKNFNGTINYAVLKKNGYLISSDKLNINVNANNNIYAKVFKDKIRLNFQPKVNIYLEAPQIEVFIEENNKSLYFFSPDIKIYKSKIKILNLIGLLAKADNKKFVAYPFFHSGIFKGQVETLRYWFSNKRLRVKARGNLNKQSISEVLQILSVDGDAQYALNYGGKVDKFISEANLKIYSNNLKLKSSYIIGIVHVKDLIAYLNNGVLNLKLSAEDNLALLSKGNIDLYATSYINKKQVYAYAEISNLPVRYLSLFKGNVNSSLNLELKDSKGKISGQILLAGNLKLNISSLRKKASNNKNRNLEKIKLNIKISSYLPIYIYGDWGEAYAEIKGNLTGSLASPIFNGEITIIYGKISYMKNRFNIDFANIKISNNIPFLTARLSTVVATTHIFINISGNPPDDLTFNFSSTPPRSKEEIMAILLLRDTPNTLENIPVFTAFGKLIRSILPLDSFLFFGDAEGTFFNTGFDITIAPRYSPTEGIVATIYAKRDITRRIFVALSKPISQTTSQTLVGWYEGGYRMTQSISLFTRFYEDGTNELGIIFNLPFDF